MYTVSGGNVHFLVQREKAPNYLRYCTGLPRRALTRREMMARVIDYTTNPRCYCSNTALNTDQCLDEHGPYIRDLKFCFGKMKGWRGTLYRGLDMSSIELRRMQELGTFFIPAFTSASKNRDRAFGGNTLMVINARRASWTLDIGHDSRLSPHHHSENEVLICCYSLFKYDGCSLDGDRLIIYLQAY